MSSLWSRHEAVVLIPSFVRLVITAIVIRSCCDEVCSVVAYTQLCNMDIPSRTALASVVIEGRTRRVETVPSRKVRTSESLDDGDSSYFNVTVKPRTVFKGDLAKDPQEGYLPIVIGEFASDEDRDYCIPSVRLGARYIFFLNATATAPSVLNRQMSFYRLAGFPAPPTNDTLNVVQQYSCSKCTSFPTAAMFPERSVLELQWRRKLHLRCSTSGRPSPRVVWIKDGAEVKPNGHIQIKNYTHRSGSHLRIVEVSESDRGSYHCLALSVLGQSRSNATLVSVQTNLPTRPHAELCTTLNYCLNDGICYILPAIGRKFCV